MKTPYLPQEIITNILKRLPVKTLIRFQCVCKEWNNLFKTSYFIKQHSLHYTLQNSCLVFIRRSDRNVPWDLSLRNGLLCLSSDSLILWNPVSGEVLHMPKPPNLVDNGVYYKGHGFSAIIVYDFKIMVHWWHNVSDRITCTIDVFSLRTWSWK